MPTPFDPLAEVRAVNAARRAAAAADEVAHPIPPATPPRPPVAAGPPDAAGALAWCLSQHTTRRPCPPSGGGRNAWLAALSIFCNERGVPLADLLTWAESAPELAGHNDGKPNRIRDTVTRLYREGSAAHGCNHYTAPRAATDRIKPDTAPRAGARIGRETPAPDGQPTHGRADYVADVLTLETALRARVGQPITFAEPLFFQDEEPVCWPHTLVLVQGQTGQHKSRVAELLATVALAYPNAPTCDTLGLRFNPPPRPDGTPDACRVCYLDTERNLREELPYAVGNMIRRAGGNPAAPPDAFRFASLAQVPERRQRLPTVRGWLADCRRGFDGHLLLVLDVLSDCVASFNDESESLALFDYTGQLLQQENVTLIVVLHENPGQHGGKARGHLGTEAANKASTVLHVGRVRKADGEETDVVALKYLKRRRAGHGFTYYAQFDADAGTLVRADAAAVADLPTAPARPRKAPTADVLAALPKLLATPLPAGKLAEVLAQRFGTTPRTINERLAELTNGGASLLDTAGQLCELVKTPTGKEILYELRALSVGE